MLENYEEFSEAEIKSLRRYVTNTTGSVFVLRNLPEVVKGALFSRYSRSKLGLRSLLLKEFILDDEAGLLQMGEEESSDQTVAIQKAQNFYDRILDGYGDDSIGELGGAHLALENISMIAAKVIEDCRIGGSPLEKSTRYVSFDQKFQGEYLFYRDPILMTSAYRDIFLNACNRLFDTYSKLIAPLTEIMEKRFPQVPDTSTVAYTAALRAKVLDCLRGLLPAGTLTNVGLYGNGRFFEAMLQKLHSCRLTELGEIGQAAYQELSKTIPSFVRRAAADHKYQRSFTNYVENMRGELSRLTQAQNFALDHKVVQPGVKLIGYDLNGPYQVAASLLFPHCHMELMHLEAHCRTLSDDALGRILEAACQFRENRRHKPPRGTERASFTFEIVADFGVYRDLQRHRMLTQDRQLLTCNLGYYVPEEIIDTPMEAEYVSAIEMSQEAYQKIKAEFPEEAQYVVAMAHHMRWCFHVNLRSLEWICSLRSASAGHSTYRSIAQEMAKQVSAAIPAFERFFKFVDYEGYVLGRLGQEMRTHQKKEKLKTNH